MGSTVGEIFNFRTNDGETRIPVSDAEFFTDDMDMLAYNRGECFLQFYDVNDNPVTPSAGTIEFTSGVFSNQFLPPPDNAVINATDVSIGEPPYTPPSFNSAVRFSKMRLSNIAGATHVRAFHWRTK